MDNSKHPILQDLNTQMEQVPVPLSALTPMDLSAFELLKLLIDFLCSE